jgi:hypothetical protein
VAVQGNALIDFTRWLFKCIAILVAGVVVLAILVGGGWWTWNWWSYERHKDRIEVVAMNIATPGLPKSKFITELDQKDVGTLCGGEFPIFVGYVNNSSRTIEYISIDVTARLPERSTNILTYDSTVKSDQIIQPGGGFGICSRFVVDKDYKDNPEITKAIYSGKINYVRFKDD